MRIVLVKYEFCEGIFIKKRIIKILFFIFIVSIVASIAIFIPMHLTDAVNCFSALGQLKSGKEIACVFEFDDGNHPLIAYLDENFFHCEQENFVGQAYLLCKVIRKTPKGSAILCILVFCYHNSGYADDMTNSNYDKMDFSPVYNIEL